MTIKRSTRIATLAVVAAAGLSGQAAAAPAPVGTISNGAPKPVVVWDHAAWKQCWTITYAQWRKDGVSPNGSAAAADLTCGDPPL